MADTEMAGYIIESFKGPGGGYYINKNDIMNIDYFNKYDLEVLDRVEENIKNISDNKLISDFNKLNKKLHSIYNTNKILSEYKNVDVTVNKNDEKINIIDKCIKDKKSLLINYLGTSGKIVKREIIPINMFEFEDVNAKEISVDVMRIIDKIEKIGEEKVRAELRESVRGRLCSRPNKFQRVHRPVYGCQEKVSKNKQPHVSGC